MSHFSPSQSTGILLMVLHVFCVRMCFFTYCSSGAQLSINTIMSSVCLRSNDVNSMTMGTTVHCLCFMGGLLSAQMFMVL